MKLIDFSELLELGNAHCLSYFVKCTTFEYNTRRFIMFSLITNTYNKKTKYPTLMVLFTATGKLKKFFFCQLEVFDLYTTGDMAHIDTIFTFLPHTHVNMGASIFFTAAMIRAFRSTRLRGNCTLPTLHEMHIAQ